MHCKAYFHSGESSIWFKLRGSSLSFDTSLHSKSYIVSLIIIKIFIITEISVQSVHVHGVQNQVMKIYH